MISATFIFATKQIDDAYLELDRQIAEAARKTPGYIGEESWTGADSGMISTVYYWESMTGLRTLMKNEQHRQAKAQYENWIRGYRVEISRVLKCYGDGRMPVRGSSKHSGEPASLDR